MSSFLASDYYPPPLMGGHAIHVRLLGQELVQRRHEVEVVSPTGPEGPLIEMNGDVVVQRIAGWNRACRRFSTNAERTLRATARDLGLVRTLTKLIRQRPPVVLHWHGWILCSLLPFLPSPQTRRFGGLT